MKLLGCVLLLCGLVFAQSDRGSITGVISDPAGAVIPAAAIEARNTATGGIYQVVSTATGNYTLSELPTGPYELSVTVAGFKKFVRQGLDLQVSQTLRIDATLEIGGAAESVTVSEAAPLLKTESGELSHNVTAERVDELPVGQIGGVRNILTAAQLLPGVVYSPGSVRLNGAPTNTQNTRIEGQDATYGLGQILNSVTQPSVDAIQEYAIQTSNYAAEYGQAGGGVFNVTMRSGTNQFHGSGYDYFSNEALNAYGSFTHTRGRFRRNDYGLTVGGPVWIPKVYDGRNKSFFFFSWEDLPQSTLNTTTFNTVPTPAFRNGDFSAAEAAVGNKVLGTDVLNRPIIQNAIYDPATERSATVGGQTYIVRDPFPGNKIDPSRFDPVALKIQSLVPLPAGPNAGLLVNNGLYPFPTDNRNFISSLKFDHLLSARHKVSFFWSRTHSDSNYSPGAPIGGGAEGLPQPISEASSTRFYGHRYTLSYDFSVTPTVLFHLGAGYQDSGLFTFAPTTNYDVTKELGLKGPFQPYTFPNLSGMLSTIGLTPAYGGLKNLGEIIQGEQNTLMQKPTAVAGLTWVKNNHTYKFGAEMRLQGYPNYNILGTNGTYGFSAAETALPYLNSTTVGGSTIGFPYASFLLGLVDNANIRVPAVSRLGNQQWGFYAQDSWKVTHRLTLDYGLRYDYSTYQKEQYGRQGNFAATTPNPSAGGLPGAVIYEGTCNCSFAHNYPWAFGPRLGFAYQILPKTVLRGGFGIIYNGTANNNIATRSVTSSNPFSSPSFGQPAMILSQGVPFTAAQIAWPNFNPGYYPISGTLTGPPNYIDPNAGRPARQYEWSIGLQREITRDLVVEATYVGSRGIWWPAGTLVNYNALTPQQLLADGLDINNSPDRDILNAPLNSPRAGRFQNKLPYPGFPATSTVAQSLRPFPQFSSGLAPTWAPLGKTWYDSLQVKATKRLSHGLDFTYAFTWQKSLNMGSESDGGTAATIQVNDVFNRQLDKILSSLDQKFAQVIAFNYTTPKWGRNKILSYVVSGWQTDGILTYASGLPILSPLAQNNLNPLLFRGGNATFANRVAGVPLFTQDLNCGCFDPNTTFVLNPKAWTDPPAGQFGSAAAYYDDYRARRRPQENFAVGRQFRITETTSLSIRAEFTNIFNRTVLPAPTSTNALQPQTRVNNNDPNSPATGGFGWLNTTTAGTSRQGQIVARFRF